MVFNWYNYCEQLDKTHVIGKSNTRGVEYLYLRYLLTLKLDRSQCFDHWVKIQDGIANIFKEDYEQVLIEFDHLYDVALKDGPLTVKKTPITFYRSEIDFLNNSDMSYISKIYYLGVLGWFKHCYHYGKDKKYNNAVKNYIWRHLQEFTGKKDKHKYSIDMLVQDGIRLKLFEWKGSPRPGSPWYCQSLSYFHEDGEKMMTLQSFDDIQEAFVLIKKDVRVCRTCGKEFEITPKTKTDLCPDCYKQKEKERKRVLAAKLRKNKK